MNWESIISPAVIVAIAAIGGFGGYMTLRGTLQAEGRESARRFAEGESDRKELRSKIEALERDSVRRGDLAGVKGEIIERIKDVEHALRGSQTVAIGEMREMLKTMLDRAFSVTGSRA